MLSSILKIVIAASVANDKLLILEMAGSRIPHFRLFWTAPVFRLRP